jgi:hypothetical protein
MLHLFHGWDIERWLIKAMIATYKSKLCGISDATHRLPPLATKFFDQHLASPAGMYVPVRADASSSVAYFIAPYATIGLLTYEDYVVGIEILLGGLPLRMLAVTDVSVIERHTAGHVLRPRAINFQNAGAVASVTIAWYEGGDRVLWLSPEGPNAPLPSN